MLFSSTYLKTPLRPHPGDTVDQALTHGGTIWGARRYAIVSMHDGLNSVDMEIDAGGAGLFDLSLGANTSGDAYLEYCGFNCNGLWYDMLGGGVNALEVEVVYNDLPVDIRIVVTPSELSGPVEVTKTTTGGIFSPTSLIFPYSEFIPGEEFPAAFSEVYKIQVYIEPPFPGADLQLDHIVRSQISAPSVPEPSTYAMAAAGLTGLIGVASYRRRRPTRM